MVGNSKNKIMIVDDNVTNLNIARKALEQKYEVILIPSGEKALAILSKIKPDLILLDIEMPGMNGFEVIKKIKELPAPVCDIPVIFLTAKDDNNSEYEGLNLGAMDYIIKPFSFPLLLKRVELHMKLSHQQNELQNYSLNLEEMVVEKTKEITKLQYAVVQALSDVVERRDGSTGEHILRTRDYLKLLMQKMIEKKVYEETLYGLDPELYSQASQMHDVGKIAIPDSILLKEGRLTPIEFDIIKAHTTIGAETILKATMNVQSAEFLRVAAEFAMTHHEKWDGSGYPNGLKGEDIPISGRMMAIVDVYDALISERPYKVALPHEEAMEIILKDKGTHFDPILIDVFVEIADTFKTISESYA